MARVTSRACAVAAALALAAGPAAAQLYTTEDDNTFSIRESPDFTTPPPRTSTSPFITFEGHVEGFLQLDANFPQTDLDVYAPWKTLFGEAESRININFGQYFSIATLLRFERGEYLTSDTAFASEVLYVQRLFGIVHLKPVHFYAGKILPRFGVGWYLTPGLYGTDFDTDYELYEKVGAGVRLDIYKFGRHRFTAETFHADTSFLQASLLPGTRRTAYLNLSDGGVGNTGRFDNFALALSGDSMPALPGFSYQVGWEKQSASPTDTNDEYGWSAAMVWNLPLWRPDFTLSPMVEWVSVIGQGGANRNIKYLTAAATLKLGDAWSIAIHTTKRYVNDYVLDQFRTDSLLGFAVAYQFVDWKDMLPWLANVTAIAGYRQTIAFGSAFQTLGAQLKYSIDF